MRMFNPEQEAGDMDGLFRQPPPDFYFVKVEDIERKKAQTGTIYLNVTLRVVGGEYEDCKLWDTFSLLEQSLWKLGSFAVSCGQNEAFDIDNDSAINSALKGRIGKCKTKYEVYEGDQKTKVQKWLKMEPEERAQINQIEGRSDNPEAPNGPSGKYNPSNSPF